MGFVIVAMVAAIVVACLPAFGQPDDGPWPMFRHDAQHTGRSPYVGPERPILKWSYPTDDAITWSSPAVGADGTIYVGSTDGTFYAINSDGSLKWNYPTGIWNNIHSSPAVGANGTIYVSLYDKLCALKSDGSMKWSYPMLNCTVSSPAVDSDGTIYVGSLDWRLYAIEDSLTFGYLKWSYYTSGSIGIASPAVDGDSTIYIGSDDGRLYAIDSTGYLKWSYPTDDAVKSSPAVDSDGIIYIGSYDHKLYAINPDGSIKWSYPTAGGICSSPALEADGTIYVGSDHKLYAINPNGSLKWSYETGTYVNSSPAIDADGTIYVGSHDYNLYAINNDGSLKWSYLTNGFVESSTAVGVDSLIYVGSYDGKLYAIGSAPPLSIQFDPYQTRVPRGGTLDFEGAYTNWEDTLAKAEVVFEAYLPGGIEPARIFTDIKTFYPDPDTLYYALLVPMLAPKKKGYLLKGEIIVPPGSGEVMYADSFFFEVKPAMESLPFGFE
jgi:outer membrane protein assembly factor BamB